MQSPGHRPVKRVRAFHNKSSDGCKTCRIRHIKCDKEKPACKKCSTTGRTCDGYFPGPPVTRPRTSHFPPSNTSATPSSPLSLPLSTNSLESSQERRSFSFFCQHTIPQLSGSFDVCSFWTHYLLQAAHHEPAIVHAAIALGALHEQFSAPLNSTSNLTFELSEKEITEVFAMQQYSKAIKALTREKAVGEDVALVTCVLFIYFETLRGHLATAISHIDGGVKILSSPSYTPSPYVSKEALTLLFIRLDTQADVIIANRQTGQHTLMKPELDGVVCGYAAGEIPREFKSLLESRNALDYYIRTHALRGFEEVKAAAARGETGKVSVLLRYVSSTASLRLKMWDVAFEAFVTRREREMGLGGIKGRGEGKEVREWREAVNLMRVHRISWSFFYCIDLERAMVDETLWDEYTEDFKTVVALAEEIIGPREDGSKECRRAKRVLCLDAGIVLPLYFVATKCRVRRIRWKAIELLRRTERQEGLWNSVLTALVAERVIRIEEEGMGWEEEVGSREEVISRENRVRGVILGLDVEERKAFLRYGRCRDKDGRWSVMGTGNVEWIEEWVRW